MQSVRTLMTGIIDYAGLYPPAKLSMREAVKNYAAYLEGPESWMLGRFVLPVAKLGEFEAESASLLPQIDGEEAWRLSALPGDDLNADIDRIFEFNRAHADGDDSSHHPGAGDGSGHNPGPGSREPAPARRTSRTGAAVIDSVEVKVVSSQQIERALGVIPEQLEPYFEIPLTADPRGMVAALSGTGARAKVRTGGVTPDTFPEAKLIAAFMVACSAADVPFKATAGLHHAVRGEFPLTYEPSCPRGMMFGFLNVFLAAAFTRVRAVTEAEATELLTERDPKAFKFDGSGIAWRNKRLDNARLARVRETFAISFGSCSFTEPVDELRALRLLDSQ
ncbi:MAG TPA: hypothetical protein VG797_04845 [Phycisphaerales bacterium]|nr:hypothetical protein [Phycisphaerales bacterium]